MFTCTVQSVNIINVGGIKIDKYYLTILFYEILHKINRNTFKKNNAFPVIKKVIMQNVCSWRPALFSTVTSYRLLIKDEVHNESPWTKWGDWKAII